MSEKRFTYFKVPLGFGKQAIKDNANDEVFDFTLSNVLDKLNEQQDQISYWKHKVSSLLWILGQFDKAKVKELLKELEDE